MHEHIADSTVSTAIFALFINIIKLNVEPHVASRLCISQLRFTCDQKYDTLQNHRQKMTGT